MARIRTIKPSMWGDEKFARVSRDARLLFVGLISMADDDGRFLASPAAVIGYLYPNDDDVTVPKFRRGWSELTSVGLIVPYDHEGIRYGALLHFRRHQRISHPQVSALPAPQGCLL